MKKHFGFYIYFVGFRLCNNSISDGDVIWRLMRWQGNYTLRSWKD